MREFYSLLICALLGNITMFFWRSWTPPFLWQDVWHLGLSCLVTVVLTAPVIGFWLCIKHRQNW